MCYPNLLQSRAAPKTDEVKLGFLPLCFADSGGCFVLLNTSFVLSEHKLRQMSIKVINASFEAALAPGRPLDIELFPRQLVLERSGSYTDDSIQVVFFDKELPSFDTLCTK